MFDKNHESIKGLYISGATKSPPKMYAKEAFLTPLKLLFKTFDPARPLMVIKAPQSASTFKKMNLSLKL